MENNQSTQEEKPSTHSRKVQTTVFVGIVVLLVLVLINSWSKSRSKAPEKESRPTVIQTEESIASRNNKFADKLRQAESSKKKTGAEESKAKFIERLKEAPKKAKIALDNGGPVDEWQQEELQRVRTSRYDDYSLDLGSNSTKLAFQGVTPIANRSNEPALNSDSSRIQAKQAQTRRALDKATSYLDQIEGGELGNDLQAPKTLSNAFGGERVVGQAASKSPEGRKAGEELLPIGRLVTAAFDQKIMSDYVGPFRLRVTQDVYDVSNRYVLIPKGSIASCESKLVSNINEPIQARVGYIINYMVLPDGSKIDFKSQAGLDREGIAAVKDTVDRHFLAQFFGVAAYALVSNESSRDSANVSGDGSYAGQVGEGTREIGSSFAQKYLSLVPTITLRVGTPARIFIEEEMFIKPWERISAKYVN